jgi:hypothetical protein
MKTLTRIIDRVYKPRVIHSYNLPPSLCLKKTLQSNLKFKETFKDNKLTFLEAEPTNKIVSS